MAHALTTAVVFIIEVDGLLFSVSPVRGSLYNSTSPLTALTSINEPAMVCVLL